jgi:peptidoglycan/xylan/chitin deacetylase (PgdA/CDA1 family)
VRSAAGDMVVEPGAVAAARYDVAGKGRARDDPRSAVLASLRLLALSVLLVLSSPFVGLSWLVEKGTGSRAEVWKRLLLVVHGAAFSDLTVVGGRLFARSAGECVCRIPRPLAAGESRIGLTIDDAPGDSPREMHALLDVLKSAGARCTFFVTTNFVLGSSEQEQVMARAVAEGHELGNHMPEDRPYVSYDAAAFERELLSAKAVLDRFAPGGQWYRPPMGRLTEEMVRVVRKHYPYIALGDVFSGDPFLGGNVDPPRRSAIDFHVWYNKRWVEPGSVVIIHVPNATRRRQTVPVLKELLAYWSAQGWSCVPLRDFCQDPQGAGAAAAARTAGGSDAPRAAHAVDDVALAL